MMDESSDIMEHTAKKENVKNRNKKAEYEKEKIPKERKEYWNKSIDIFFLSEICLETQVREKKFTKETKHREKEGGGGEGGGGEGCDAGERRKGEEKRRSRRKKRCSIIRK